MFVVAAAMVAIAAAGCRNVLGIPDETRVPTFAIRGTVTGMRGVSATPMIRIGEHFVTPEADGPFVIEGVGNGTSGKLAADPACVVDNPDVVVEGADVEGIVVKCDGLVSLRSLTATAPLDIPFSPTSLQIESKASFVVKETAFAFEAAYVDVGTSAVAKLGNGTYDGGVVALGEPIELTVTLTNAAFDAPRTYRLTVGPATALEAFAYGKPVAAIENVRYATTVATDGDVLVIGIPDHPEGGRAIVHRRNGLAWTEEATLVGAIGTQRFGTCVGVWVKDASVQVPAAPTIVVGAPGEGATGAGYVFTFEGNSWQQMRLSGETPGEQFGSACAVVGNTAIFGAPGNDSIPGAAYRFDGAIRTKLVPPVRSNGDRFGASVAIARNSLPRIVAIGAPGADPDGVVDGGLAFTGELTIQQQAQSPDVDSGDLFGAAVALDGSGDTLYVGAPLEDSLGGTPNEDAPSAGAVYQFRILQTWTPMSTIKALDIDAGDNFGAALAMAGDVLAIGAPFDDSGVIGDPSNEASLDAGAVYVRREDGTLFYAKALNPGANDAFGTSISISRQMLAVGAPYEDSAATGWNGGTNDGSIDTGAVYGVR